MLLLDYSQVGYAVVAQQVGFQNSEPVSEPLVRHMLLNTIRANLVKFKAEFGTKLVICCDDRNYWRKDVFPYYKAARKKNREKTGLDWPAVFAAMDTIRDELAEYFPYLVVRAEGAEADDVMGEIVRQHEAACNLGVKPGDVLIISGDEDFVQLHRSNVKQWNPVRKNWVVSDVPSVDLAEKIIRGDPGDGVPNVLSDDDTFMVESKRQKTLTKKKMTELLLTLPQGLGELKHQRNYKRNEQLIDLKYTPLIIRHRIGNALVEQNKKPIDGKLFDYFMKKGLRNLMERVNEFQAD